MDALFGFSAKTLRKPNTFTPTLTQVKPGNPSKQRPHLR